MVSLSFDIGIKNLSCCALAFTDNDEACEILAWEVLPLVEEGTKVKKIAMDYLSLALFSQLDGLMAKLEDCDLTNVLIESQPCMKNPVMKTVQVMVYTYFMMRKHMMGNVDAVHLVFAGAKNNATYHSYTLPDPPKANMKPYDLRKWQSMEYTKLYIANDEALVKVFNSHKKKDDLSDTFTQACVWHKRNKLHVKAFENVRSVQKTA